VLDNCNNFSLKETGIFCNKYLYDESANLVLRMNVRKLTG